MKTAAPSNLTRTFTCWFSISCTLPNKILPPGITKEHLEEFFTMKSKEVIGEFHSLKLTLNQKYNNHQCFVNFLSEKSAKSAVDFFKKIDLEKMNLNLEVKYREPEKNTDPNQNPLLNAELKLKKNEIETESSSNLAKKKTHLSSAEKMKDQNVSSLKTQDEENKRYI